MSNTSKIVERILARTLSEQAGNSTAMYNEISKMLKMIDSKVKKMATAQSQMKHPTDEFAKIKSDLKNIVDFLGESVEYTSEEAVNEDHPMDYETAKRRVSRLKKGSTVSFTSSKDGTRKSGEYKGLINRGGRSYAKVEMGARDGMMMVPVTQIH